LQLLDGYRSIKLCFFQKMLQIYHYA
jgi:hypothetical protein